MSLLKAESEISSLTDAQEMVLSILPIPSALLSIAGSSLIIYLVLKTKKESRNPYKRILLGMSICDIIISITYVLQAFLLPRETSQRVWAAGNDASCSALGFLLQFSFSAFLYNGMLSFYYLLTIRFGMSDRSVSRYIEPLMHILSIGYPLVTAIAGAFVGLYNETEIGMACWVNDYPENCGTDPDETGESCQSELIAWIFGGLPVMIMILCILINNIIITLFVRRTIGRSRGRSAANNTNLQTKRIRAVATQASLYVLAFLSTTMFLVTLKILEGVGYDSQNEDKIFVLLVLQAIFAPLTGAFNFLVYLRPRYLRVRRDFPSERSRLWAARRALFGDVVEPSDESRCPRTSYSEGSQTAARWSSRILRKHEVGKETEQVKVQQLDEQGNP